MGEDLIHRGYVRMHLAWMRGMTTPDGPEETTIDRVIKMIDEAPKWEAPGATEIVEPEPVVSLAEAAKLTAAEPVQIEVATRPAASLPSGGVAPARGMVSRIEAAGRSGARPPAPRARVRQAVAWQDFPDDVVAGVYWVRWRATQGSNLWHATRDGERTICGRRVWGSLYVGRESRRCDHCLTRVAAGGFATPDA